jgi:hypothetical protein
MLMLFSLEMRGPVELRLFSETIRGILLLLHINISHMWHLSRWLKAEAIAMKEGLSLTNSIGCNVVLAESDAMEVIQACDGEEAWWGESAAIYADCVDIAVTIRSVFYLHCMREANKVAHSLARKSFSKKIYCNWVDEPPDFILDELLNDVIKV